MNIWLGIPTGQRAHKLPPLLDAWKQHNVKIIAYTWDSESRAILESQVDSLFIGKRKSFAILHNLMIKSIGNQIDQK